MSSPIVAQPSYAASPAFAPQYGGVQAPPNTGLSSGDSSSYGNYTPPSGYGGSYVTGQASAPKQSNQNFWLWIAAAVFGTAAIVALGAWAVSPKNNTPKPADPNNANGDNARPAGGNTKDAPMSNGLKQESLDALKAHRVKLEEKVQQLESAVKAAEADVSKAEKRIEIAKSKVPGATESLMEDSEKKYSEAHDQLLAARKAAETALINLEYADRELRVGIELDKTSEFIELAQEAVSTANTEAGKIGAAKSKLDNAKKLPATDNTRQKEIDEAQNAYNDAVQNAKSAVKSAQELVDRASGHATTLSDTISKERKDMKTEIRSRNKMTETAAAEVAEARHAPAASRHDKKAEAAAKQKLQAATEKYELLKNASDELGRPPEQFDTKVEQAASISNDILDLQNELSAALDADNEEIAAKLEQAKTKADTLTAKVNGNVPQGEVKGKRIGGIKNSFNTASVKDGINNEDGFKKKLSDAKDRCLEAELLLELRGRQRAIYNPALIKETADSNLAVAKEAHEQAKFDLREQDRKIVSFGRI